MNLGQLPANPYGPWNLRVGYEDESGTRRPMYTL